MCDQCAALQEEVAYLRSRLADKLDADLVRIVMKTFGLTFGEARVISALYQSRGLLLKSWELEAAVDEDRAREYDGNCMQVHILRIRRKTSRDFVTTFKRAGYGLSDQARLLVANAITEDSQARTLDVAVVLPARGESFWSAERVGVLARMRRDGRTYSEIGRYLKCSTNAAIGAGDRYLKDAAA